MGEDDTVKTRRWARIQTPVVAAETAIRVAINDIRKAPRDPEGRRVLHALAAELGNWEELAVLLAEEARAAKDPAVAVAFYSELADIHDNLDQPLETIAAMEAVVAHEPEDTKQADHLDRLARLYHQAGAWQRAAEAFERVAGLAFDARARAALLAAGRLYRDNGKPERAIETYRALLDRKPSDADALHALDELLAGLGRWLEVADVRGALTERSAGGLEKAALLRAQARALEQAGKTAAAAELVARAAGHAPEDVSGLVDYAQVLAREGRGLEAAEILRQRVAAAEADARPMLRMRLAIVLDDAGDRAAAAAVLNELLAETPDHAPALERQVKHASADPRTHAEALVRYAGAISAPNDRAALFVEAARLFRSAGDDRAALRALEAASDHAPDDRELAAELDEARTTVAIADAQAHADRANPEAALRRLRATLEVHPFHPVANLALVDLLERLGRLDGASEHLQTTLANAPTTLAPEKLARLVFRYAQVRAALRDTDEAHQLLHEAHRLDRKDLAITLGLGESCFTRRLWREAAIHLGGLATHPHAAQHAAAVAIGLVHAAQAEIRGMRSQHAPKHYLAAAKLDPDNGKAWHALAELAIERDDMPKAAEYLEKEANVTTDPAERIRLYDALGDLALEHLEDPARAERCWSKVSDIGVLGKLLALQRARHATTERGDTCVALAALDLARTRELGGEAIEAYTAGGNLERAADAARTLAARHPTDLDAIVASSAIGHALEPEQLRRVLHTATAGDPRATLLWARLGDAERVRKNDRAARIAYDKAIAAAGDPASADGVLLARRGIVELGHASGIPLGAASLAAIVAADPRPAEIIAWARALAGDDPVDARAAFELALGMGARLSDDDHRFLAAHRARPMASDEAYAGPLDDTDRKALVDDADDSPLGELLDLLAEVAQVVSPDPQSALREAGLGTAQRLAASSDAEAAALYPQIAKLLGGPPTLLYSIGHRGTGATFDHPAAATLLWASPPIVVIGPELAEQRARSRSDAMADGGDAELRFRLARIVELSRPRRVFAASPQFSRFIARIVAAFGSPADTSAEADKLRTSLPVIVRRRLTDKLATLGTPDTTAYLTACQRAADRAALLACGDASVAVAAAPHLARLAASPRYLAVRRRLRRS